MKIFWLCCKNKFLSSYHCNHCPDSAILIMHNAPDTYTLCGPMCYVSSMRWNTVLESWESMKGESSSLGLANARILFSFLFSLRRVFSFFFSQEANKCFPFIIIYYFARYSCIACIMLLKPMLARSPRSFRD